MHVEGTLSILVYCVLVFFIRCGFQKIGYLKTPLNASEKLLLMLKEIPNQNDNFI